MGGCCSAPIDFEEEVWLGHFSLGNAIGKGGFTRVKLVEYRKTQETFALKFMDKKAIIARKATKNYLQERKVLEELDHPYITNLRWAFQDDKYLYFVLDLMMGGDLRFHHDRKWCPGEPAIKIWVAQVACAIGYLHSKKIIHRDMKIDNILLDLNGHAHVSDFNCATWIDPSHKHEAVMGTKRYMAPEMISGTGYNWEIDYWGLGAIVYEMLFWDIPFGKKAKTPEALYKAIREDELEFPPDADKLCSKEGQNFIKGLLQKQPKQRLGCRGLRRGQQDIRNHPWFQGIKWDELEVGKVTSAFIPNAEKLNFNISHELDEFMVTEKPLTQGRRRKKDRDMEKLSKAERDMEEQFTAFDHTKSARKTYDPYRQNLSNLQIDTDSSSAVHPPLSVTPEPTSRPSRRLSSVLTSALPAARRPRPVTICAMAKESPPKSCEGRGSQETSDAAS